MMPPFNGTCRLGLNFLRITVVLVALAFSLGCDKKQGVKIGDTPPDFSGTDISGEFVGPRQVKGKVVVLYFWTDSCCGERLKLLEPFYRRHRDRGLAVLAINVGDSRETVESYVRETALPFSFQTDDHKMLSGRYGVFGFPTIFVLDRNGVIREKILGNIPPAKLEKLVTQYL